MEIPLLSKEDIKKEDDGIEDKDIRDQIIEFLKNKVYKHVPGENQVFSDDTSDLFIKDDQSIEVIKDDQSIEVIIGDEYETDIHSVKKNEE